MYFLSLDQAARVSGYAVFDENKKIITYGYFDIPANKTVEDRLDCFWKQIDYIYEDYKFNHIFFEGIQYQQNAETYKKLAYIQAIILIWCKQKNITYNILMPSHWRAILKDVYGVGFGRSRAEQKSKAVAFVKKEYGLNVSSDISDAICLGLAALIEKDKSKSAF